MLRFLQTTLFTYLYAGWLEGRLICLNSPSQLLTSCYQAVPKLSVQRASYQLSQLNVSA